MNIDMSQFYQVFFDESEEHLSEMERLLLVLNVDDPNIEDLNAIFRAAHSIKGGSGTFGFTDMTEVTHVLENLLDRLRKGEMAPRMDMIDAFLESVDVLKQQLVCHTQNSSCDPEPSLTIREKLRALTQDVLEQAMPTAVTTTPSAPAADSSEAGINEQQKYYIIDFSLNNADRKAVDGTLIALRELGELEVLAEPDAKALKKKKKKDNAPVSWQLKLTSDASLNEVRGQFEFLTDPDQVLIVEHADKPETPQTVIEDDGYGFFTELPEQTKPKEIDDGYGFFTEISPPSASPSTSPDGKTSDATPAVPLANDRRDATHDDRRTSAPRANERNGGSTETSSIRVSIEKVDQLINLVGELVITQAMLAQTASMLDPVQHEALHRGTAQLERNTRDLQESVMSIRMMPISFVFSRFPRVVRDLASKLNKQVELVTIGENTELDKGLIEKIADPLTHLVRNSLDHGIEIPEKRRAAGKPEKGTITLSAAHQGGSIVVEVGDDGAGLNRAKILAKARERGLPVSDSMSDGDVWLLIFEAGFSTADVITDVSGRGVGMDVVRRNINEMGGNVEIESVSGQGSKIRVRLPLTLAILDGMTVALGDNIFVVPLNLIIETLQPAAADIKSVTGQGQVVNVRGEYVPLIALHKMFNLEPQFNDPTQGVLVIIEDKGKKSALFVDALVGQQQVVIKSLETNYRKVNGVSGATIMGDGRVALILDVPALIKLGQTHG
ncbi:MAG TPA: chemotaxis protein CheA [Methylophilaceae bacterium]